MQTGIMRYAGALVLSSLLLVSAQAQTQANQSADKGSAHDHSHGADKAHDHSGDASKTVYKGYFEDSQIKARPLSNWAGDWQSVYPYLQDGTLDPVMAARASNQYTLNGRCLRLIWS